MSPGGASTADGGPGHGRTRRVVDARGLACPAPVLRLAAAAHDAPHGTVVTVLWTDPAARHDIPAWVRMRGHELVDDDPRPDDGTAADEGCTSIRVVRR